MNEHKELAHKQFEEDLALYALGTLELPERVAFEKHLTECAACRRELEQLRGDSALLAMSAPQEVPPARARKRLMSAIAAETRPTRAPKPRASWMWIPSLAAAALAIVAVLLWRQDTNLRRQFASLEEDFSQQQAQLRAANEVLATLTDPAAVRFTLSAANTPPRPQGKAIYARSRGSLIFLATNMPALPPQKAYELWLIPASGAPIPAGLFKPDPNGSATVIDPPLPGNVEAKTFAITVEPEAGSPAPTSQPIMVGTGG
jgi:anti-sigma-K factor RskA